MADHPIIFSTPMVKALLSGRKMQTRRKLDGWCEYPPAFVDEGVVVAFDENEKQYRWPRTHAVGDRLWVKERCAIVPSTAYRMSDGVQQTIDPTDPYNAAVYMAGWDRSMIRFRSSLHMPRWASRITLIVEGVKVERLREISREDAKAEGLEWVSPTFGVKGIAPTWREDPRDSYFALWDHINGSEGTGSSSANPWVVAISFRVVKQNIDKIGEQ